MKKTLCLISLCLPLISEAWGTRYAIPAPDQITNINMNFPYNADQEWFTDEGYLLWKTFQGDMAYTVFDTQPSSDLAAIPHKAKVKNPDYGWSSGVRIGIGKYLPNHDLWDVNLYTTYYYATADNDRKASNSTEGVNPIWTFPSTFGSMDEAHLSSRINYFTWDLSIRRAYSILPTVIVYPYIGIRAALIYQKYDTRYFEAFAPISSFIGRKSTNSLSNDFWGLGPRIGSNLVWNFRKHWSFLGNFASSFVWGQQTIQEHIVEKLLAVNPSGNIINHTDYDDKDGPLRMNIEGSLGLGWEKWVRHHSVRIAPSFMFEGTLWLSMNQVPHITNEGGNIPGVTTSLKTVRHHGNLGMMGVSFNLQIDF